MVRVRGAVIVFILPAHALAAAPCPAAVEGFHHGGAAVLGIVVAVGEEALYASVREFKQVGLPVLLVPDHLGFAPGFASVAAAAHHDSVEPFDVPESNAALGAHREDVAVCQLQDLRIRKTHCGTLSGNRSVIGLEQDPRSGPMLVILAHNVPYPGPLSAFQPPVIDHHEQSVLQPFYAWIAGIFLIVREIAANGEFLRPYGVAEVGHGLQHALKLATDVGSGNDLAPVHLHHRMEYDTLFRLRCR